MGFGLRKDDLKANALRKIADAQILLANRSYSNAYYLAGYAVELSLKVCIAAQMSADVIPDKKLIEKTYQHDLRALLGAAGLATPHKDQEQADPLFAAHWALVVEWGPESRYEARDAGSAQLLISSILHNPSGVLPWIQTHW